MKKITRRDFMRSSAGAAGAMLALRCGGSISAEMSTSERIARAIPAEPVVKPDKGRRLLIFDRNVGYGGHGSAKTANEAFKLMGKKSGAFETTVSSDPRVFERSSLERFDAVFFNNTVGNLFEDKILRRNLVEFVYSGGGLMGVHGTSVAFTVWPGAHEDWREFGVMLGARGANHRESTEHVHIKLDDPSHPVNGVFGGKGFEYRDEHFRFQDVYSRRRVRVLFSIDTEKTNMAQGRELGRVFREDNDYALAWVRGYGRGRVFYCTIAHNPYVFWDPGMLRFYLGATQFALGDLKAPTTPSAFLTPAVKAREGLGWRLGLSRTDSTFAGLVDEANEAGLLYVGAASSQRLSGGETFGPGLSGDRMSAIRLAMDEAAVRLLTYRVADFPNDESDCRKLFEFGRSMGVEAFIGKPSDDAISRIEKMCDEYDIELAVDGIGMRKAWQLCRSRSKRVGIHCRFNQWLRDGLDPAKAVRRLGNRLKVVNLDGCGPAAAANILRQLHEADIRPVMFALQQPQSAAIKSFNEACIELA